MNRLLEFVMPTDLPPVVTSEVFEMRFCLLDQIQSLRPGSSITAVRTLTGQEDYLADHFPLFPVMPGVLMLEALYQASAWLLRATDDFQFTVVTLKEARNVKYSDFVVPGRTLQVTAEIQKREGALTTLKAQGMVNGSVAVGGRLVLESFCLGDRFPARAASDRRARARFREYFERLGGPQALMQESQVASS